jgi:phosphomannomutase
MSDPIISVSGLRGVVGSELTPEVAMRYVAAFATELPAGPMVVSRDGRPSGRMLADVVCGTLCGLGRQVINAGVAATPTTGILVRDKQAAGAIQITASHNPAPYNGCKLFGADGRVLSETAGRRVLDRLRGEASFRWADHARVGTVECEPNALLPHRDRVLSIVDADAIRERHFAVLLDSNHGAGGLLGRSLLDELGCRVRHLGAEPTGLFVHDPEPVKDNLAGVCREVPASRSAVGFCQDPDADRLALVDEMGRYVGEEYTLAVCVNHVLASHPGPIVSNCSTSRMSEDLAATYDVPSYRSKVGEAHVVDLMLQTRAVFGGEGNGGPIDPRVGYVRDSFVGIALVLDAMAKRRVPLSVLVDELPRYEMCKAKAAIRAEKLSEFFGQLANRFPGARADRTDGLRLDWSDRWLLVRASNTEPIVRLTAEAPDEASARALCQQATDVLGRPA